MERYLLAFTTWDDNECEYVERVKTFDSENDLLDDVAYLATKQGDEMISICKLNFRTLGVKKLELQLNATLKLVVKEVI
ncbi:MAG: hypothetical protein RR603_03320 [Kurthia sp.]